MAGIWGKLIGSAAGFALGGPLGALVGLAGGHVVDRVRASRADDQTDETRQTAFTIAVIALSAKMAKADGHVTRDEIDTFKRMFHVSPTELKNVGRVFDLARKDARGYEPYARQVARMFVHNSAVLEELLATLFLIAKADKIIHPAELEYLRGVADIFGFDEPTFERIRASHVGADTADPYAVLGVPHDAPDEDIRTAWRHLIRENHPDTLIAQGMPQDFIDIATQKMAAINSAWDQIRTQRGLR